MRTAVRAYIRDNGTTKRFSDVDVNEAIEIPALDTLNAWAKSLYAVNAGGDVTPSFVSSAHRVLYLLMCKREGLMLDAQDTKRYAKFVTQDIQYDPSEVASRINRTLKLVEDDIDKKVRKWIGIDSGLALTHRGEQIGGE